MSFSIIKCINMIKPWINRNNKISFDKISIFSLPIVIRYMEDNTNNIATQCLSIVRYFISLNNTFWYIRTIILIASYIQGKESVKYTSNHLSPLLILRYYIIIITWIILWIFFITFFILESAFLIFRISLIIYFVNIYYLNNGIVYKIY